MVLDKNKLADIQNYIKQNYVEPERIIFAERAYGSKPIDNDFSNQYSLYDDVSGLKKRVKSNINDSWQEALFHIIDTKFLDEVEVYKRGGLTKQTFSKAQFTYLQALDLSCLA